MSASSTGPIRSPSQPLRPLAGNDLVTRPSGRGRITRAVQEKAITLRVKRQECRCVRNPRNTGAMTCSCAQTASALQADPSHLEALQQNEVAQELTNSIQASPQSPQARCGCVQIVYLGTSQFQCQCGDVNGNPLPVTTTTASTTTTMRPITLPATLLPPTVEHPFLPSATEGPGQCQCIMIRISGPSSAQYQCDCNNGNQQVQTLPPVTYPPVTVAPTLAPQPAMTQPLQTAPQQYPLTTGCVVYVGLQNSPCICLPQYDQCAQNTCCLKAKFRSHKGISQPLHDAEPTTVDMLMNILKKLKTKLNE
ncbi:unnamed protein product [Heligmosomoides polygyrus]|uniref:CC domain-containing protein n=1 Tax=Heligmosomoides polygyrus TaxID=6339 RepID=A0A3P8EMZ6_HELPZ|nr:unnamed protein product [Heligmosomoides polygyrus]